MFTENMGDYFQPSRCFSFAKPTVVCSYFRGCTSPEVGGTCGLVPTSLPWQSGSQDGDSAPGMATQGGGSLGSSVWKKRKGVQRKARSQSVEPSREVVSFSPDHLSQDPGFLYSISSSQLNLTPQSWLTPFSCCLALKCYLLPSAFEAYSTKCISEVCWQLILSLACDMGDLGRESWTPTQPAVSCVWPATWLGRQIPSPCKPPEACSLWGAVFFLPNMFNYSQLID